MTSPVGPILLIVILIVVLIVIIFNLVSGMLQIPAAVVSNVGSSLGWLFGEDAESDDIVELYAGFESKMPTSMEDARTYYKSEISAISFGERDSLSLNGADFYPASSADEYIQTFFAELDYDDPDHEDDCLYLMELCYINKIREEREAQGLGEDEMPEVTLDESDFEDFLVNFCFSFNIEILQNQSCPPADCETGTRTDYGEEYYDDCYEDEDSELTSCPGHYTCGCDPASSCTGHEVEYKYCSHTHIKAVITIQQISIDEIENGMALTEDEQNMFEIGIDIVKDALGKTDETP